MKIRPLLLPLALLTLSGAAAAHTGHSPALQTIHAGQAFAAGLLHPVTGADHMLAMLALGIWCGLLLSRQWLPPMAFAGSMALGLLLTQTPVSLPAVEPMVIASLLALGLLLIAQHRLPVRRAMALAAVFALFHGFAHGEVFPSVLSAPVFWSYMGGMVVASLLLHAVGVSAGLWLKRQPHPLNRWAGRALGLGAMGYGAFTLIA